MPIPSEPPGGRKLIIEAFAVRLRWKSDPRFASVTGLGLLDGTLTIRRRQHLYTSPFQHVTPRFRIVCALSRPGKGGHVVGQPLQHSGGLVSVKSGLFRPSTLMWRPSWHGRTKKDTRAIAALSPRLAKCTTCPCNQALALPRKLEIWLVSQVSGTLRPTTDFAGQSSLCVDLAVSRCRRITCT